MEDFLVLSILDVQFDRQDVDKRQIQCYIMLGEDCIDNLILGSHADQVQGSGDTGDQEERGSNFQPNNVKGGKRTKINVSDIRCANRVQIIINYRGKRLGSVSFTVKRIQQITSQKIIHWVTLYDSLDDDLFEGQLGRDELDIPRAFLEYFVVSSKSQKQQWTLPVESKIDISQTIEFRETRSAKLSGNADRPPRFLNEFQMEQYQNQKQHIATSVNPNYQLSRQQEWARTMQVLQETIGQYDIKNFKTKIHDDVQSCLDSIHQNAAPEIDEVTRFLDLMCQSHDNLEPAQNVITYAFQSYAEFIHDTEAQDIKKLKQKIQELKHLQTMIEQDCEEADQFKKKLIESRLKIQQFLKTSNQFQQLKNDIQYFQKELEIANKAQKIQSAENFSDMSNGRDQLYNKNKQTIVKFYERVNEDQRQQYRNKVQAIKQLIGDQKLNNMILEEQIDDLLDQQVVIKLDTKLVNKQIQKTLKHADIFIREEEILVRKILSDIENTKADLAKCTSDKQKFKQAKDNLFTKYLKLTDDRVQERNRFEGEIEHKQSQFDSMDQRRVDVAKFYDNKSNDLKQLSTKIPIDPIPQSDEAKQLRLQLSQLLEQLKQKMTLLLTQKLKKQFFDDKKLVNDNTIGGQVDQAVNNLTIFSKDCCVDLEQMHQTLDGTTKKIRERAQLTTEQDKEIKKKQAEHEKLQAKLLQLQRSQSTSLPELMKQNYSKDNTIKKLAAKIGNGQHDLDKQMQQKLQGHHTKQGPLDEFSKISSGVYLFGGVLVVTLESKKDSLYVNYVKNDAVVSERIDYFLQ